MIEPIVQISVRRAPAVLASAAIVLVVAAVLASRLSLDALPDVTPNQVLILTRAPGLVPEEVERLVSRPIELALGGVSGLESQRSISRYGLSAVTAVFADEADPFRARQLVAERIASLSFPEGVDAPELGPFSGGLGEIFQFTLSSPERSGADLLELVQTRVSPLLRKVPGVVEVNSWGGEQRTIEVRADPVRMAARGLTWADLKESLGKAVGAQPGAAVASGAGQVLLRGVARPTEAQDLALAIVGRREGEAPLRLSDVAEVVEGGSPRLGAATRDGAGEIVYVMAQMIRGENALRVMERVDAVLPELRRALPPDVELEVVYDRSTLVHATLRTVFKNMLEGGALVIAVLFLLLGSARAGLVVASAIPGSMLIGAAGMVLFGIPGNLMSLGAIDFGLVVDGGVVMVERIFHVLDPAHHPEMRTLPATERRARVREVATSLARPVFFSVLVILAVYVPVLSMTGVDGKMFRPMALTMIFALAGSLALSLTVIPALAALVLRPQDVPKREPWVMRLIDRAHARLLALSSPRPGAVALGAAALLIMGGVVLANLGTEFVPQLDEGDLVIQTTRAADISLSQAVLDASALEEAVRAAAPEVKRVSSRIGSPAVATDVMGIEQADVFVALAPRAEWRPGLEREALIEQIRASIARVSPDLELAFTQPIQMRFNELIGGDVSDVSVSFFAEDLALLRRTSEAAAAVLARVPGASDVRVMAPEDVPVLEVRPKPIFAAQAGLSASDVLDVVRAARMGLPVATTWRGPIAVPIVVRYAASPSAFDVPNLRVPLPNGGLVSLSQVADVLALEAPGLINHRGGERRLVVGFNVRGADLGVVGQVAAERLAAELPLGPGIRLEWGGQLESLREARDRLLLVLPAVVLLIAFLLFGAFRRVGPALLIMTHVPFATVGGILILAVRGMAISISSAIGFIALSGVAVLNGVVLMHQVLDNQRKGMDAKAAALEAARARARPVVMTALVAALGFVPMMLATGIGAEVQRPLATVVVGGLLTSTLLTLIILPTLYPWVGRLASRRET